MHQKLLNLNLSGLEVLIAEDDSISASILERSLFQCGARAEIAASGKEALQKFSKRHFPIVITDINMPGMTGFELAGRIKALAQNTQIIATTVNDDTDSLITALELGFSDYFIKPFSLKKLLLAVRRCTDVIRVSKQLEVEREQFKSVLECLGDGVSIKDLDFRILYQNRAMTEMYGNRIGSTCYSVFGQDEPCMDCPTILTLKEGKNHSSTRTYQLNGVTWHIESTASLLKDADGKVTGTIEIIRDISNRISNEQVIREMAYQDPLTGLANRRLFKDRLEQAIAKARRYGSKFALLYLDLDNFKDINDSLGHEAGDQVLIEVAERIRSCCKRDLDTISRQGGDEFCIIIDDCGDKDQLGAIAEHLLTQVARPFHVENTSVQVTVSIGIGIYPDNGAVMKELEIASDRAMYAAKKAGRNTYRFWRTDWGQAAQSERA